MTIPTMPTLRVTANAFLQDELHAIDIALGVLFRPAGSTYAATMEAQQLPNLLKYFRKYSWKTSPLNKVAKYKSASGKWYASPVRLHSVYVTTVHVFVGQTDRYGDVPLKAISETGRA